MTPTAKIRFFERTIHFNSGSTVDGIPITGVQKFRVLQQWWEHTEWNAPGEWRDVPLEKEE
jgi:hypothetical protein